MFQESWLWYDCSAMHLHLITLSLLEDRRLLIRVT